MKFKIVLIALLPFMLFSSCNNAKKVKVEKSVIQAEVSKNMDEGLLSMADFHLKVPTTWMRETPANNMRKAQFALKSHPEVKIVVSHFGNVGNQVDENIARWKKQFSVVEKAETLSLKAASLVAVRIDGTYQLKAFPMAQKFEEKADYAMLAAIIPTKEGPYFIKVAAAKELIASAQADFVAMLNSYSN